MGRRDRLTRLGGGGHLPRRTVRLRLTALYGALFLSSGIALLTVTYLLLSRATSDCSFARTPNGATVTMCGSSAGAIGAPPKEASQTTGGGTVEIRGLTPRPAQ